MSTCGPSPAVPSMQMSQPIDDWAPVLAIYDHLRHAAKAHLCGHSASQSLGATGLVHEAVLRLLHKRGITADSTHREVFRVAMRAMRDILIERARARSCLKRGGNWNRIDLDSVLDGFEQAKLDFMDVNHALEQLSILDFRQYQIVHMRYILQMTNKEIARKLDVSISTVEGDLRMARAWLMRELGPSQSDWIDSSSGETSRERWSSGLDDTRPLAADS